MNEPTVGFRNLESLKKEAKRWLNALHSGDAGARARLLEAVPEMPAEPTLRDVQHALAREHGFAGWTDLKTAVESRTPVTSMMSHYEDAAMALLDAYRTGTPEAMARHYRLTWHRRVWQTMRAYVQLDLGKRPAKPGDDVEITLDDARFLVAREHGFANWEELTAFANSAQAKANRNATTQSNAALPLAKKSIGIFERTSHGDPRILMHTRDWNELFEAIPNFPHGELHTEGQITDTILRHLTQFEELETLDLGGSHGVSDDGIMLLARLPRLRKLNLAGTSITNRALDVLQSLPLLESLTLSGTRVTDEGMHALRHCDALVWLEMMGTLTGDGAIAALAGKPTLAHFASGNAVTDAGLRLLNDLPVFKTWQHDNADSSQRDAAPNSLVLRGPFTDAGMRNLTALDGLASLNVDDRALSISAEAMRPLVALPRLGWLSADAKDDWMPFIAAMPRLRFLDIQDTPAGDDGFTALGKSQTIERIWGRRCHNLRTRGFVALANMPRLRSLSVSCLNVDDSGIATLPTFPALRELMPMDIPDEGYRHIAKCTALEALTLMYCRDTTDRATEHIAGLSLRRYFNSYTTITDRTPELLSVMDTLEEVTFDQCHGLTNGGIARLARLPKLRVLRVAGRAVTGELRTKFPNAAVVVNGQ